MSNYSLNEKELELMIYRIRVKQLFELNFSLPKIKSIIGKNYSDKTLYSWKKLKWEVKSIVIKKSTGAPFKTTHNINKKIKNMATKKKMSLRQISNTIKIKKLCPETVRKILIKQGLKPFKRRVVGRTTNLHEKGKSTPRICKQTQKRTTIIF